ncbi:oxidoreductase [Novosphingobium fuchskuhlense]|uniref:Oxidoreductase n=1 Tax=Novosphingobium fuchskuhlense TaxID=1117702 RepID=A0A117UZ15_9SPHN|nr:SDR family oxidoreductase [Novosphingobium fuchskuhlense]KUR73455.1 oxidoreductase [Novosphingobium fuchskuhlense]
MTNLSGKVAVVIGAAGENNMGQHIARTLADAGAKVVVAGRKAEPLKACAGAIAGDWALCDLSKKADVEALATTALDRHGKVDIAINATGWGLLKGLHEITEEELDQIIALQLKGVHYFLSAFVRAMPHGGSLIQISSATTQCVIDDHAAYIATKAGSEALIRCVANQYGPQGIRANVLSPGFTYSPMTEQSFAVPGLADAFIKEYPLGRVGTSEDIAKAALWVVSDDCFMSGQNLQINGGLTLRRNPRPNEIQAAVGAAMAALQASGN